MRKFPKNKRFKYLIYLHYLGLISLPNYHRTARTNWAHHYIYRSLVYILGLIAITFQLTSALIFARHQLEEFMYTILEFFYLMSFFLEAFLFNLKLENFLDLLELMDQVYSETQDALAQKYDREEALFLKILLMIVSSLFVAVVLETLFPSSAETINMLKQVYRMEHPHRKLPFPVQSPFFDTTNMKHYPQMYVFELYVFILVLASVIQVVLVESVFSTSVEGQYERFSKYVALIGCELRNEKGEVIYCTDIKEGHLVPKQRLHVPKNKQNVPKRASEKSYKFSFFPFSRVL